MSEKQPEKKDALIEEIEVTTEEKEIEVKRQILDETGGGEPKNATGS